MVISKKTIIFQSVKQGPTFSARGCVSIETAYPPLNPCMIYKLVFASIEDLDKTASLQSDQSL